MTKSVLFINENIVRSKVSFFMLFINLCVRVKHNCKKMNTIQQQKNPPMWKKMPLIRSGSQDVLCCASYRENSIKFVMELKKKSARSHK